MTAHVSFFVDGDDEMMRLIEWNLPLIWPFTSDDVMWWDLIVRQTEEDYFDVEEKVRGTKWSKKAKKKNEIFIRCEMIKIVRLSDYKMREATPNAEHWNKKHVSEPMVKNRIDSSQNK